MNNPKFELTDGEIQACSTEPTILRCMARTHEDIASDAETLGDEGRSSYHITRASELKAKADIEERVMKGRGDHLAAPTQGAGTVPVALEYLNEHDEKWYPLQIADIKAVFNERKYVLREAAPVASAGAEPTDEQLRLLGWSNWISDGNYVDRAGTTRRFHAAANAQADWSGYQIQSLLSDADRLAKYPGTAAATLFDCARVIRNFLAANAKPASGTAEKFEWARKLYDVSESAPGELQRFWDVAIRSAAAAPAIAQVPMTDAAQAPDDMSRSQLLEALQQQENIIQGYIAASTQATSVQVDSVGPLESDQSQPTVDHDEWLVIWTDRSQSFRDERPSDATFKECRIYRRTLLKAVMQSGIADMGRRSTEES